VPLYLTDRDAAVIDSATSSARFIDESGSGQDWQTECAVPQELAAKKMTGSRVPGEGNAIGGWNGTSETAQTSETDVTLVSECCDYVVTLGDFRAQKASKRLACWCGIEVVAKAVIGVVLHEAAHECGSGKIGPGCECGCIEGRQAAPEIEWVGKFFEPNFFWKENLGLDGRAIAAIGIAPGGEFSVLKNRIKVGGVEHEHAFELGSIGEWGAARFRELGDAKAFASKHEPEDAQFPILEAVYGWMGPSIKIEQWAGGDEGFASALAAREDEGDNRLEAFRVPELPQFRPRPRSPCLGDRDSFLRLSPSIF
jgi:hypothetical protein